MDANKIPFHELLEALLDADTPFKPAFLYRLSDLEANELDQLKTVWGQVPLWRRQALMEDIKVLSLRDTLLYFVQLALFGAQDGDPLVRLNAVQTLWEYEENRLAAVFLGLLRTDPDHSVRTAAATGLGRFVYLGEIEELPRATLHEIENALLDVANNEQSEALQRAALEALGFSGRDEVPPLIEKAYKSKKASWLVSALIAMGRSCSPEWKIKVLEMIDHTRPDVRMEAAHAAGELEIKAAIPSLLEMLDDPDEDVQAASIWALSQIGGEEIQEILEDLLEESQDEEQIEFIEAAIDNLIFNQSLLLPIIDLQGDDIYDLDDDFVDDLDDDLDELENLDLDEAY